MRVISLRAPGQVTIDRGTRDGLRVGDLVELRPRAGGVYPGRVRTVSDRNAEVDLDDRRARLTSGTRGVAFLPSERFAKPKDPKATDPRDPKATDPKDPKATDPKVKDPDDPRKWENRDEDYEPGMPLLAKVGAVRPERRPMRWSGNYYVFGDAVSDFRSSSRESFLRTGVTAIGENPVGRGGVFELDAEFANLTETDERRGSDLYIRQLSYTTGGTRFAPDRLEFGRFLHHEMPEFGILDGAQWSRRVNDQARVGASIGFLPENGEDQDTFEDFQFAGYYLWTPDDAERLQLGIGYQKTLHNGRQDRDLLVLRGHLAPGDGWRFHGTASIDIYLGNEQARNEKVALSHALLSARYDDAEGGIDWSWQHIEIPDILRDGEFLRLAPEEVAGDIFDRLSVHKWAQWDKDTRARAYLSGWVDENSAGGSIELSREDRGAFGLDGTLGSSVFGGRGRFVDNLGVRFTYGEFDGPWRWDALYEWSWQRLIDQDDDSNDLFQHRLRGSTGYASVDAGWDLSLHAEVDLVDDDLGWLVGIYFQKGF